MKNKPQGLMVAIGMPKGGADAGDQGADQDGRDGEGYDKGDNDNSNEDCVALSSLAMPDPDNGDQMANPEVGDRVTYTVEGTVTRIEGEDAYVKRETINGQPVSGQSNEDEGPGDQEDQADQDERNQLGGMAQGMGGMS